MQIKTLDIFCEIIDNFGDIGVVYRLAKEMKSIYKDEIEIRVILSRLEEFLAINKKAIDTEYQKIDDIIYITNEYLVKNIYTIKPANVIIEAFGCNIFDGYLQRAKEESSLLINLEYLSGERWIEDVHKMESLMGAKKLRKFFFMPGFTDKTGGVIVDSLFLERKKRVIANKDRYLEKYLKGYDYQERIIGTVFSYEKNFTPLLEELEKLDKKVLLLVMGEKTQNSIKGIEYKSYKNIEIVFYPFVSQESYEEILNLADFNFVRGEDSFIRAILTGKPFMWHIYLQDEMAHMDKINGFIERYIEVMSNNENEVPLKTHTKLLRDYNYREENTLELGIERFEDFFKELKNIEKISMNYSEYLINNCNLIEKLNRFILEY